MISWQLINAVTALLIPPGLLIVVSAAGLALLRSRPRAGHALLVAGTAGLYLLSMPLTGTFLLQHWETPPGEVEHATAAQAIVVLGAGKYPQAPEYGGDTVTPTTLVRLRYAAVLHRRTGLPILVSGGSPEGSSIDEAQTMRRVLEQEFGTTVRWSENQSANTLENARLTHRMLQQEGIRRICLVTHAWHMPRARLAFEHAGFEVIAAPTAHATRYRLTVMDMLPDPGALLDSALFFREVIGTVWYRLRLFAQA
jgi:uncharacterized SAM-binding protein YcdF (DUF218 family)